jgi:hypothetical protein
LIADILNAVAKDAFIRVISMANPWPVSRPEAARRDVLFVAQCFYLMKADNDISSTAFWD